MKLLSVTVPCYNSEGYMRHCIESLLPGGEDVEILIVDDGSVKDRTAEIADEYQEKYPTIVRAIHQENKGHGGAVNTGIENATGIYFKVVDSDDWVDAAAYQKVLAAIRKIVRGPEAVDVIFSNYVYNKESSKRKNFVMRYQKFFPQDKVFGWDEMKHMDPYHYVLMHSIIYRTDLLREVGLKLPEHTFYVDNLYAYIPFSKVRTMYYCYCNLYQYFIGRADQSVNETVMIGRMEQQYRVNYAMIDFWKNHRNEIHGRQREFLLHDLSIILGVSSILAIRAGDKESLKKMDDLWKKMKEVDPIAYFHLRHNIMGTLLHIKGKGGRKLIVKGYHIAQKIYGFV
ncbi:MAG: glycosyltransferase family 2 protein [Eubacterium sp.]|nr:glycosyltransferase family 2 protein [Eubacterium sp.]